MCISSQEIYLSFQHTYKKKTTKALHTITLEHMQNILPRN